MILLLLLKILRFAQDDTGEGTQDDTEEEIQDDIGERTLNDIVEALGVSPEVVLRTMVHSANKVPMQNN